MLELAVIVIAVLAAAVAVRIAALHPRHRGRPALNLWLGSDGWSASMPLCGQCRCPPERDRTTW
jgi:hypothetical protein